MDLGRATYFLIKVDSNSEFLKSIGQMSVCDIGLLQGIIQVETKDFHFANTG